MDSDRVFTTMWTRTAKTEGSGRVLAATEVGSFVYQTDLTNLDVLCHHVYYYILIVRSLYQQIRVSCMFLWRVLPHMISLALRVFPDTFSLAM